MSDCIRRPHSRWSTCPCEDCRRDRLRTKKLVRSGRLPRVSSEAAWAVIDNRIVLGWSAMAIASAAGLHDRTIQSAISARHVHGQTREFGPIIAAQIVNMGSPTRGHVSAIGTCRRLQALAAIGWPLAPIAERAGVAAMTLSYLRSGRHESVSVTTAAAVAAVYDELCMVPSASAQPRRLAAKHGWAAPLAWDDIDDPAEEPHATVPDDPDAIDEAAVDRRIAGTYVRLTHAEATEVVARLRERGWNNERIYQRTGLNPSRYCGSRERRAS